MAKRSVQPEDLLRFVFVSDPQMRPDGSAVLFTKKTIGDKNNYRTQVVSVDLEGNVTEWTRIDGKATHGRWSPDGTQIAFLSGRDTPASQIFLLDTAGGEARALTSLPEGDIGDFRWSPDGSHIAYSFRETHPDWTEKARIEREEKGLSTPARVANTANYRLDGDGFYLDQRHALFVIELETGATHRILEGCPWGRYSFDWSPDSQRLAIKRSFQKNPWTDPEDDRILVVSLDGEAVELSGQPGGFKMAVRWSPDGKWIAYLGNPDPLDHRGTANTELFVAPSKGGEAKRLIQDTDFDLETGTLSDSGELGGEYLEWLPDSSGLLVNLGWWGTNHLGRVTLAGELEPLTEGKRVITPGGPSRDGTHIACLVSDPLRLAEPAIVKSGEVRILKSFNAPLLKELRLSEPKEVILSAADGYPVHAWMLRPRGAKNGEATAGVLEVHGGPQAQYGWTYFHEFQVLAAAGYTVVYSNPRGSKGYGKAHCQAIAGSWGGKDWLDIEAVKDWMKSQAGLDARRIGIMGGSYGGYMVNWAVGHTNDFRAAITDRCVSNLIAKALNSDYPYYPGTHWKGSGYGPLESNADLWHDSPLAYFGNVKTPMLIIHSEGDLRCNIEQGEQVFSTLQYRGVKSRFVRYPVNTSHGMSRGGPPDLRIHRLREILRWWKESF